jgi:hypothetical protein
MLAVAHIDDCYVVNSPAVRIEVMLPEVLDCSLLDYLAGSGDLSTRSGIVSSRGQQEQQTDRRYQHACSVYAVSEPEHGMDRGVYFLDNGEF